jgi:hypothetical protein
MTRCYVLTLQSQSFILFYWRTHRSICHKNWHFGRFKFKRFWFKFLQVIHLGEWKKCVKQLKHWVIADQIVNRSLVSSVSPVAISRRHINSWCKRRSVSPSCPQVLGAHILVGSGGIICCVRVWYHRRPRSMAVQQLNIFLVFVGFY